MIELNQFIIGVVLVGLIGSLIAIRSTIKFNKHLSNRIDEIWGDLNVAETDEEIEAAIDKSKGLVDYVNRHSTSVSLLNVEKMLSLSASVAAKMIILQIRRASPKPENVE